MGDLYSELSSVAAELLGDFGQTITLSREVGGVDNPGLGETTGSSISTWTGSGAALNYNSNEIDGVAIKADDIRLVLEAVDTPPKVGDGVTFGGNSYEVIMVNQTNPAGTPVVYTLQIRV